MSLGTILLIILVIILLGGFSGFGGVQRSRYVPACRRDRDDRSQHSLVKVLRCKNRRHAAHFLLLASRGRGDVSGRDSSGGV